MAAGPLTDAQYRQQLDALEKREAVRRREDLRALMDTAEGRRFVFWLIFEHLGLQTISFIDETRDGVSAALRQAWRDGPRHKALQLHNELRDTFPRQFLAMMGEQIAHAGEVASLSKVYQADAEQRQQESDG